MKNKSNIELKSLFLLNTEFKRPLEFNSKDEKISLGISINNKKNENTLTVFLAIKVSMVNQPEFLANVEMAGVFEYDSTNIPVAIDDFAKINAPAILFPFIREHLATLSAKANMNRILLPPLNFVALAKEDKPSENIIE